MNPRRSADDRAEFRTLAQLSRDPADPPAAAVVIDVMRACTVAAWVCGRGAEKILLAGTDQHALELTARHPGRPALKDGRLRPPGSVPSTHGPASPRGPI